jgi:signal peptide peptidase SppA
MAKRNAGVLERLGLGRLRRPPTVAVLRLHGVIGPAGGPLRSSLNLAGLAATIERAFQPRRFAAVALSINSPGGSPVQSSLIAGRIRDLSIERGMPVYAFCEDVAASGGYWLALAGDEIHAHPTSVVGSIGVIAAGFGFHDLIGRIGVERRVHTAGEHKSFLDPFRPEQPEDVARLKDLLGDLHVAFRDEVRERRGDRLAAADGTDLFNGDVWTGRRARDLGLVDGLDDLRTSMRTRFGEKVRLRVVNRERGWFGRRFGMASGGVGADAALAALEWAEARAAWSRFGL